MRKIAIILLLCTLFIGLLAFSLPYIPVLAIEYEDSGTLIAYGKKSAFTEFEIHYIHSIHQSPVVELYELTSSNIVQQQITYEEFAVGMPSNDEGEGQFVYEDGSYRIKNMNRIFPYLDIRIAQVMPDHGIIIQNRLIPFSLIAKPGSWIRLKESKISLWQWMKGVDLLERKQSSGSRDYR